MLDEVADGVVSALDGLGFELIHKWAPHAGDLSQLPAAVVEMPTVTRPEPQRREDQLGAMRWGLSFPVVLYVLAEDMLYGQALAVEMADKVVSAIDANPTLGLAAVDEARIVRAGPPEIYERETPIIIGYPTELVVVAYAVGG